MAPLDGVLSALDGGLKQDPTSDNRANKIDNLEDRLNATSAVATDARFGHPALDAKLLTVVRPFVELELFAHLI